MKIISGGTDNHLMLVDLRDEEVTGKELERRLDEAHITCNKNTIPNDPRSPFVDKWCKTRNTSRYNKRHGRRGYGCDWWKVLHL